MNVVGFKRGYGYMDEVLALAKPFGKVVRHLVLDVRPEVTALRCCPDHLNHSSFAVAIQTFLMRDHLMQCVEMFIMH